MGRKKKVIEEVAVVEEPIDVIDLEIDNIAKKEATKPKKIATKPKLIVKTVRVRMRCKDSILGVKSVNGYAEIPENKVAILERRGLVKREK